MTCPVITQTENELKSLIVPTFTIGKNKYGQFTLTITVNEESITLQELFSSEDLVQNRITWCAQVGLIGKVVTL